MNGDVPNLSGEELQNALNSILSNPEFGKMVEHIRGNSDGTETPQDIPKNASQIPPDVLARIPQMMSALAPLVSGMSGGKKADPSEKPGGSGTGEAEKRKKLLSALRPYLNQHRKDAVDNIMKVSDMTDLLGGLSKTKPKP